MRAVNPFVHILLIIAIALAPLVAGAGMVTGMDEGSTHAHDQITHQPMGSNHASVLEDAGDATPEDECSGMDSAADCCASCVGCALPLAVSVHLEPVSFAVRERTFHRPQPDPESEIRPPRTHSS